MNLMKIVAAILFFTVISMACNKENIVHKNTPVLNASRLSEAVVSVCDKFAYADTIFYLKQSGTTYIIKPLNTLAGEFGAYPSGLLNINATTGAINITQSETGLKYMVWFIASGSKDTCKKYITISGVDYTDSVYTLNKSSVLANPIYNANKAQAIDCSGGCVFDDGGAAAAKGIAINKKTGKIDLKKTVQNGAFGATPVNGAFKDFVLNYRISDKSSKALNKMALRIYYYATQAQVPAKLKEEIETKKGEIVNDDGNGGGGHHGGGGPGNGGSGGGDDFSSNSNIVSASVTNNAVAAKQGGTTKCRPPYIIVTAK